MVFQGRPEGGEGAEVVGPPGVLPPLYIIHTMP